MSRLKVIGWGFIPLPGEKKRHQRAEREAREQLRLAEEAGRRSEPDISELVAALIFNGLTQASSDGPEEWWLPLSQRLRYAEAAYEELRAHGIQFRNSGPAGSES